MGTAKIPEDKTEKSQSKISGFFTPKSNTKKKLESEDVEEELQSPAKETTDARKRITSGDSDDRPDSGFASRAETPAVWSEAGSKAGSPCKDVDEVKDDEKKLKPKLILNLPVRKMKLITAKLKLLSNQMKMTQGNQIRQKRYRAFSHP